MAQSPAPTPPPTLRHNHRTSRLATWLWLVVVGVLAWTAARSDYVADLSAFLPTRPTAEQAMLLDQLRGGMAARLVLIGVEGGDDSERAAASRQLALTLRDSGAFESVHNGEQAPWQATAEVLFAHRYSLSPAVDAQRFSADGLRAAIGDTLALLGTPAGTWIKPTLLRDPTGEMVQIAGALLPARSPRSEHGVWVSRDAPRAVLLAMTRADGADLDGQQQALDAVRRGFAPMAAQGLTLQLSGPGRFAVDSRETIRAEVERLAAVGAALIVALLWLAFGSLRSLGLVLLPVGTGVLAGIAAVSAGFGQVHGITLGFGVTLMGEAVDYAIYYLIQARGQAGSAGTATPDAVGARHWVARHWPTVRLGMWTSVCGFGALLASGFPGLVQLGVFSIAGLAAAALVTRRVLPVLAPHGASGAGLRAGLGQATAWLIGALDRRAARAVLGVVVAAAFAAWVVLPSAWRGDLVSLSPVEPALLRLDAQLRADLGAAEAGTLVVVSAESQAAVLEAAEHAAERLAPLLASGLLTGVESPAQLLPSVATQERRRAALPDRATLEAALAEATAGGPLPAARLGGFVDEVQAARGRAALTRDALAGTPLAQAVDAMLLAGANGRPWRALLSLHPGPAGLGSEQVDQVRQALAGLPQVHALEIGRELAALYDGYLREAMWQAGLGALAVVVLLGAHLRSGARLWWLCRPIAAALLLVLAAQTAAGVALGVLHLVGFLLIVAIGSNYALFFDHLRHSGASDVDTLASLELANLTTVLSFGLLATSSIPVLQAIGSVVAPGALLCLVLSAMLIAPGHRVSPPA